MSHLFLAFVLFIFHYITISLKLILAILITHHNFILDSMLTKHQLLILKRNSHNNRILFENYDKIFFAFLYKLNSKIKNAISLVKPETLLSWVRTCIKHHWTFPAPFRKPGRPSISQAIKNLVLEMKNTNIFWGYGKIQGELLKLAIDLDKKTIAKILEYFRKCGKVKKSITWSQFISSHLQSLFGCDFFTVDTIFNTRFYVFFIIHYASREIVQFGITTNPSRNFIRNQIANFSMTLQNKGFNKVYLIHDRSGELKYFNYEDYDINNIPTSVHAPNMNSLAERFIGSIRRELLDYFIILSYRQLFNLVCEYVKYYNTKRPHQGIDQQIPKGFIPQAHGKIISLPVLSGLIHTFERKAA